MKKRSILLFLAVVVILAIIAYIMIPSMVVKMITNYDPYTFEKVLGDSALRADYGIGNNDEPEDYGYSSAEISYKTFDGLQLNGWWIKSKNETDKCLVLVHGRTSNRLKTMKYLSLVTVLGLDSLYNIFIPDLRNSGKSEASKTAMGYFFGGDVVSTLRMLQIDYGQSNFILYGFSMGAMAICNATGREDLEKQLSQNGINIEKIILDSPLVNVKKILKIESDNMVLMSPLFPKIFSIYSEEINGFGENMRMSKLLPKDIPVLVLQSKDDNTTYFDVFESELNQMKNYTNISVSYFEGPDHVRMFQDERTHQKYEQVVRYFFLANP